MITRTTRTYVLFIMTLCLLFLVGPVSAQNALDDGQMSNAKVKPLSEVERRRQRVNDTYHELRFDGPSQDVIYGEDDRKDVYEVSDAFLLGLAESVCVVVEASELVNNGDGTYTLLADRWTTISGFTVCDDEPFRDQYQIGFCSGFLVGLDLIATAGHCVSASDCGSDPVAFVFGFDQLGPQADPWLIIPEDNVYFCDAVIDRARSGDLDHSVVRIDRPVVGRNPVPIRREGEVIDGEPLVMIGHPIVLPKKIDDGGQVQDANGSVGFFTASVDSYGGSSGSPVFNLASGVVEGILVRGNPDWVFGSCVRSNRCLETGCPGWEEISKTISFADSVPSLGLLVSPADNVTHIGRVGGPFDPSDTLYGLSNPACDPIDYQISLQPGGTAPILINGSTSPINGTIGAGGPDVMINLTLDSSVSQLPAGIYSTVVEFRDLSNSLSTTRRHTLDVGQTGFDVTPLDDFFTGGPEGGPFNVTKTYTVTSTRPTGVSLLVNANVDWISLNGGSDPLVIELNNTGDFAEVEVGFSEQANVLELGLHEGQVEFQNLVGGAGSTARMVELDVGRFTYRSTDTPIDIPDNSEITSRIEVSDVYCIGDVDVVMDVTHTFIGDLIIELESPGGTVVRLHDRTGGSANNIHVTYDDLTHPPDGPGQLADFDAEIVTGVWTLRVSDNAGLDIGTLDSWSLEIVAGEPSCPPVARDLDLAFPSNRLSMITLEAVSAQGTGLDYIVTSLAAEGALHDPNAGPIGTVPYTLAAGGDTVVYEPPPDFAGPDAFTYKANDGQDSSIADVKLIIGTPLRAFFFNMDSEPNPAWETQGDWAFGQPIGGGGASGGPDPSSGFTGENVYGYNLSGDYANNMPETHLTTAALDCSNMSGVTLKFRRWLGVEDAKFDRAFIRVSNDSVNWTVVWENEREVADASWELIEFDISAVADDQATVYIRWTVGATDASLIYCGWNIDDVEIWRLAPVGLGDVNCDSQVNAFDIEPFLLALFDPDEYDRQFPDCDISLADINGDGALNAFDIEPFLDLLFGP